MTKVWQLASHTFTFEKPLVMGVLNLTPDSFSDGGKFLETEAAYDQAQKLIEDGAGILDIGAESTRPGAPAIPAAIQLERLKPIFKKIKSLDVPISIDTTSSEVAEVCLDLGADVINDVSGLRDSGGEIANAAARFKAGLILMHRRGNAETMQKLATYENLIEEVSNELRFSLELALERDVPQKSIILDPGLGFSKTAEHSLYVLKEIQSFNSLGCPLLIGPSRKSFIGKVLGNEVDEREFGTAACIAYAYLHGVRFFRTHDVKSACETLKMLEAIYSANFVSNAKLGCL